MSRIKILPPHVQNMIAAGEVIERPANIVKELIENSLDAEADRIDVEIKGGGQILILVQDNGFGMSREDLLLAIKRHATSKISSSSHLFSISSFGFRGEALPSIGAVSHLKICSKTEKEEFAHCIEVFYGEAKEPTISALNKGTKVEVRDLFLKVPARLKFLKSTGVETKRCEEVFYKIALSHPDKEFNFVRDGKSRFKFQKQETILDRLSKIWHKRIVDNLREVDFTLGDGRVYGYVGDPTLSQSRGDRIIFYVNKRVVKDKVLLKALKQAYSGKILSREYPCGVLFLEIPPHDVDVNVHPAKMEVRFRDESYIFSLVYKGVTSALEEIKPVFEHNNSSNVVYHAKEYRLSLTSYDDSDYYNKNFNTLPLDDKFLDKDKENTSLLEKNLKRDEWDIGLDETYLFLENCKYLGQILNTYLLIKEKDKELLIIDQHAAHERVLYEIYKKKYNFTSQALLLPIKIEIPSDRDKKILFDLRKMGFEVKIDNKMLIVLAVPSILTHEEAKDFLEEFFNRGIDNMDEMLKLLSCKKAIKAGTPLDVQEAIELIRLWMRCKNKDFCPHGRPVAIRLGDKDLKRMFKR